VTYIALELSPQGCSDLINILSMSFVSLSVATTIIVTILIVVRILRASRFPGVQRPRLVLEILIESAALYSITSAVFIGFYASTQRIAMENVLYPETFWAAMIVSGDSVSVVNSPYSAFTQYFAPAFIMLRVALGRARSDTDWVNKVSSINFKNTQTARTGTIVIAIPDSIRSEISHNMLTYGVVDEERRSRELEAIV
jgi:hypothetical protein